MKFKKYGSIENHYRGKYIDRFTSRHPEMIEAKYLVTEKIHGANFSIHIFNYGNDVIFGKRTSLLKPEEGFMNHQSVMNQNNEKKLVDKFVEFAKKEQVQTVRIYGELFGQGVQKFDYEKLDTETNKSFRLFDIELDDKKLLPVEVFELISKLDIEYMHVPVIKITNNLQDALDTDTKFNSVFSSDKCDYYCEGVVIRPYDKDVVEIHEGKEQPYDFIVKKKNEHFTDKSKAEKKATVFVGSENFEKLLSEYKSYFTKGRIESVFSKEGMITEPKEFGKYIKLMSEDVKEDFFKDNFEEFKLLDDKEKSNILKISGQLTVNLLKQYL